MTQPNRLFILTNFDGTTFNTFEPAPSGIGVHEAYECAIRDLFGDEGFEIYKNKLKGLQNREPGQLFDLLTNELGLGIDEVSSRFGSRRMGIASFIDAKLSYMLDDISPHWPKPYPGVVDFFKAIEEGKLPVIFGLASSGHREFIKKVYEVNGLKPPEIMITSDEINALVEPRRPLYRPYPYQIAVLHSQMLRQDGYSAVGAERSLNRRDGVKNRMIFIGDHPETDAGVADRARIPFGFVPFRYPNFKPDPEKNQRLIPDFFALRQLLEDHRGDIEGGVSASEVFLGAPDSERFPPVADSDRPYNAWLRAMREGRPETAEWTGFPTTPITRGKREIA
jgi:hypothetical protein